MDKENIKKGLLKILFKPLTLLNMMKKKDERLIFFYSNLGFRDNVKAFYDYLIEHSYNEKFYIVVSINDFEDYQYRAPKHVKFVDNKEGIKYFLKAKYAFYCFGKYPIKPAKSQMVVNLWHGTPLKRIGNLEDGCEQIDYNFFTRVIASSPMYQPIMADIFGCSEDDVDVLGNPRNDEMFKINKILDTAILRGASRLIVWLPTYREYDDNMLVPLLNNEELEDLNKFLKMKNWRMIIKLHPLQEASLKDMKYSHIDIYNEKQLTDNEMTVYTILRNADALITDYSSVFFDYLMLDRPIGFVTEDFDEYKKKRGFIFDNPEDFMPGPRLENLDQIKNFLSSVDYGIDTYRDDRHEVNDMVNTYKDGRSAMRIAAAYLDN
ncbi:MAG: CDP-glycerol glycerophosphotransferase family protein [Eubacterium sp.]|nr:CDP-glycerol glycerophosphotransferase family protein [Eubacterium sp.]